MKPIICENCNQEFEDDGEGAFPTESCAFCERSLCGNCFDEHECHGHKPEITECQCCGIEQSMPIKKNEEHGDYVCAKCEAELQPMIELVKGCLKKSKAA